MLDGYSKQSINRLFNLDSRTNSYPTPSTDLILNVLQRFPNINPSWLLLGEGNMYREKNDINVIRENSTEYAGVDWRKEYLKEKDARMLLQQKYTNVLEILVHERNERK